MMIVPMSTQMPPRKKFHLQPHTQSFMPASWRSCVLHACLPSGPPPRGISLKHNRKGKGPNARTVLSFNQFYSNFVIVP